MPDESQGEAQGGGNQASGAQHGQHAGPPLPTSDLEWRARALKAEARVKELDALAAELAGKLEQAQAAAVASDRKRQLEKALSDHGAIDIETASLLIDGALANSPAPDIPGAVADLRRRKPFLFGAASRATPMSGIAPPAADGSLSAAADEARATGDRNALLRYLRMKRG